jgi:hypothetical protein
LGGRYVISDSLGLSPRGEAHAISDFVKSKPNPKACLWAFPLRFMADTTSPSHNENSLSNSFTFSTILSCHGGGCFTSLARSLGHSLSITVGARRLFVPLFERSLVIAIKSIKALHSNQMFYYPQDGYA